MHAQKRDCVPLNNLVARAHVSFGQHQDTELLNNQILRVPVSLLMRALVYNMASNILDPRALVFYLVTDGDKGSGKLHAHVARIWLQGSHRACACFQNHCNDILLRYFVEKLSRRQ